MNKDNNNENDKLDFILANTFIGALIIGYIVAGYVVITMD